MRQIIPSRQFERDKKRMAKRGVGFKKLTYIVEQLQHNQPLPRSCRPHKLTGEWLGFWECHIEPDWLLVYEVTDKAVLLAGTGSHADLFE